MGRVRPRDARRLSGSAGVRVLLNGLQGGNRSGTGRHAYELARRLAGEHEGLEVHVAWPEGVPLETGNEAFIHRIPCDSPGARLRFDQFGIHALARQINASLIHYPANVGALRGSTPSVLTVHDLSFFREPAWFRWERALYYRQASRRSIRRAARIIAVSKATALDLEAILHVPGERISIIPNGCDPVFRPDPSGEEEALRTKMGLPKRFVLFVGTVEPRKNIPRLIEAFDRIAADIPQDLVIAGRDGWKTAPVYAALAAMQHRDRVHRVDFVPPGDLPALMRLPDAFLFPSLYEGFGLPPIEAMASGTPVLVGNTSSLPEVAGDAAVFVDPLDTASIAAGIVRVSTDDALRDSLREKGLLQARGYRWERAAAETRAAYAKALR